MMMLHVIKNSPPGSLLEGGSKIMWWNVLKSKSILLLSILMFIVIIFSCNEPASAQNASIIPFDSLHWNMQAKEIVKENFQGKECIKITDGAAYLKDNFENGIIEFDISFGKERCFPGLMFRITDDKNFEFLYLRPHHSGDPDAIQYCPIFYGNDSWQLYTGEGYCAQAEYAMNEWMHVKIIIAGTKAELYLNNSSSPVLFAYQLQRVPAPGGLALDNHSSAIVRFANFSYAQSNNPPIKSIPKTIPPLAAGIIKKWKVSDVFSESALTNKTFLSNNDTKSLAWKEAESEELGFINIGRHSIKTSERILFLQNSISYQIKNKLKKCR
ncbi:MAG: hypothetical protein JST87_10630 [Bacteroidetes bacterium]|nr:hypothetical protein [Bacteroidota bacterium]